MNQPDPHIKTSDPHMVNQCAPIIGGLILLVAGFEFALGVSEAIFLTRYNNFIGGCHDIWSLILCASVVNIGVSVVTFYGFASSRSLRRAITYNEVIREPLIMISRAIVPILATTTYYQIDAACCNFWQSNAPQLWTFTVIQVMVLRIIVGSIFGIIGGILIYAMVFFCYRAVCNDHTLVGTGTRDNSHDVEAITIIHSSGMANIEPSP